MECKLNARKNSNTYALASVLRICGDVHTHAFGVSSAAGVLEWNQDYYEPCICTGTAGHSPGAGPGRVDDEWREFGPVAPWENEIAKHGMGKAAIRLALLLVDGGRRTSLRGFGRK
jgi:hypothetical protein